MDYRTGVLLKRRYIRRKYARIEEVDNQPNVVIGELPERPIPKGIAEARLLVCLIVSKHVDHLPFYRQIEQFKRNARNYRKSAFYWFFHPKSKAVMVLKIYAAPSYKYRPSPGKYH